MSYAVFGVFGFICAQIMRSLVANRVRSGDRVWCADIVTPGEEGVALGVVFGRGEYGDLTAARGKRWSA